MKEKPTKGLIFWTVLPFTVWMVYWNVGSILLTAVAALLLLGSLSSFYLPTHYLLDPSGASFKRWFTSKRLEWSKVRSVVDEQGGLFLSTFPLKNRLENFRGMFLPYRGNRDEVISLVRRYAADAAGFPKLESEDDTVEVSDKATGDPGGR